LPVLVLVAGLGMTATAQARYTSIVVDVETGRVIHDDNADARNYPASLTKMMTLYLTFEALDKHRLSLGQELPVSEHAEAQAPSKLGLRPGETIKVENAILGLVTKSANDVAVVLAEALGGSEREFAGQMTRKAQALGMTRTVFRNASGLPNDEQISTPRDMAILAQALIQDWPQYYRYFSRATFTYNGQVHHNHNHLMERYQGMDGVKTGYIQKSGFNLAASVVRNGRRLVAVVFGGPSARARDDHMANLLDHSFQRLQGGRQAPPLVADAAQQAPQSVNDTAGDRDEDEDNNRPRVIKAAATRAAPQPAARAHSAGRWAVQIGTFRNRSQAQSALAYATRHLPAHLGQASAQMTKLGNGNHAKFRARLVGFKDERSADAACAKVRIKGHACDSLAIR
jgi:D-alanyl-D-alanine carboxypeptidase